MLRLLQSVFVVCIVSLHFTFSSLSCAADADKATIPTAAQQKETAADLEEVYELSAANTKTKKQELVPKLLTVAKDAVKTKDSAQLYGILQAIFLLARDTGDTSTFMTAMQMLTENFSVHGTQGRQRLDEFLGGCDSATAFEKIVGELLPTIEQTARINRFDQAGDMLSVVEEHAIRISTTTPATQQMLEGVKKSVHDRRVAFKAYQGAVTKLAADSEDPQANFIAGAWLAVFEDDWPGALPKLAKGANESWKLAAEAELKAPQDSDEQAKMAGLWWEIANGMPDESSTKSALRKHVRLIYTRVVAKISDLLLKTAVEGRIKELTPPLDTVALKPQPAANKPVSSTSVPSNGGTDNRLPIGEAINLLNLISLPEHAIEGSWRTIDGALVCSPSPNARVMVPVVLSHNYELHLEFTRNTGSESVTITCPIAGTTCDIVVSAWNGSMGGLQTIGGKRLPDIKDKTAVIKPAKLENGRPYVMEVDVQESRGVATIKAALNGQQFVAWSGPTNQLSSLAGTNQPSLRSIGVQAYDSTVAIHNLTLKLTRGGVGYNLRDDWKNPLDVVLDTPQRDIAKECFSRNGKYYFIAPAPMAHSDAQRLAAMRQGRLLTISSEAENQFIFDQAKGRALWMAGWRPTGSKVWRDERNRPLRMLKWDSREPNNFRGNQFRLMTAGVNPNWWDKSGGEKAYACIEWGEE